MPGMNESWLDRGRATPRGRYSATADTLLRASLSTPLDWPHRTTRLGRDSLQDYRNRSMTGLSCPAELYHENSKLSQESLASMAWPTANGATVRADYLARRARRPSVPGRVVPVQPFTDLTEVTFAAQPDLLYAVEVFLLTADSLHLYEPGHGYVHLRRVDRSELDAAVASARLLDDGARPEPEGLLILVGCFPRYEILLGPRGYRTTLLDAGRLAQSLVAASPFDGTEVRVQSEFADRTLDGTVGVDGVEESTVAVVEFSRPDRRP